jgi:hypothetical protein
MHDSPPPYPGINPNYTPTYPPQTNGQQAPGMGFNPGYNPGPPAPGMGFQGAAAPPSYPGAPGASGPSYPAGSGSSYPTLPPNGFNAGFQAPSAPGSELNRILRSLRNK